MVVSGEHALNQEPVDDMSAVTPYVVQAKMLVVSSAYHGLTRLGPVDHAYLPLPLDLVAFHLLVAKQLRGRHIRQTSHDIQSALMHCNVDREELFQDLVGAALSDEESVREESQVVLALNPF
jgi:hypothetical protein